MLTCDVDLTVCPSISQGRQVRRSIKATAMICYNNIFITDVHRVTEEKDRNTIKQDVTEYKDKYVIVTTLSPSGANEAGRDTGCCVVALTFSRSLPTFRVTFLRMRDKCKVIDMQ